MFLSGKLGSNSLPPRLGNADAHQRVTAALAWQSYITFFKTYLDFENFLPGHGVGQSRLGIKVQPLWTALASDFIVGVTRLELATSRPQTRTLTN